MNLRQVEVFRALMTHGTVSAAAQFLNVSQPGVSRMLRNLEESSNVRLFDRVKGRLEPTRAAHMLHEEVEGAFVGVERVRSLMLRLSALQSGLVRVVAAHSLAHTLVLERLRPLCEERPNLQVAIDYASVAEITRGVEGGRFDIGVAIAEGPPTGLQARRLDTREFVLAVPKGHRLARQRSIRIADLAGEPLITYRRDSPAFNALSRRGLGPLLDAAKMEVGSSLIACGAAERGWGIAFADAETIRRERFQNIVAISLEEPLFITVLAFYRRESLNAAVTKLALAALSRGG